MQRKAKCKSGFLVRKSTKKKMRARWDFLSGNPKEKWVQDKIFCKEIQMKNECKSGFLEIKSKGKMSARVTF